VRNTQRRSCVSAAARSEQAAPSRPASKVTPDAPAKLTASVNIVPRAATALAGAPSDPLASFFLKCKLAW
jgi:hypothetical protein